MVVSASKGHGFHDGTLTASTFMVIICSALSTAGGLELLFLIFYTFKRYGGLYFWSLTAASLALIPYSLTLVVTFFRTNHHDLLTDIFNNFGWIVMVLGQSLVLYSRLHLVLQSPSLLRWILWLIILTTTIFYVATTAIQFGAYTTADFPKYLHASKIMEKIQMTGFAMQEFVLAGLYIKQIVQIQRVTRPGTVRETMWQLFVINALIVALDVALLVMEYLGLDAFQQAFKGASYAIKLKMEFAVLRKLIDNVRPVNSWYQSHGNVNFVPLVPFEAHSPDPGRSSSTQCLTKPIL